MSLSGDVFLSLETNADIADLLPAACKFFCSGGGRRDVGDRIQSFAFVPYFSFSFLVPALVIDVVCGKEIDVTIDSLRASLNPCIRN